MVAVIKNKSYRQLWVDVLVRKHVGDGGDFVAVVGGRVGGRDGWMDGLAVSKQKNSA
jgi:hypothetical protein